MKEVFPKISVNKLGQYFFASDAKKRSILKSLKFPSTFINAWYTEPQTAFRHFMNDEDHNITFFIQKKSEINLKKPTTDWSRARKRCCIEAIDHLKEFTEKELVDYLKYVGEKKVLKDDFELPVKGVLIHAKPDVLLLDKKTKEIHGFIKLIFSKSRAIDFQEGNAIATTIKLQMERRFKKEFDTINCIAIDVFHRRKFSSADSLDKSYRDINLACEEIIKLWPTIQK